MGEMGSLQVMPPFISPYPSDSRSMVGMFDLCLNEVLPRKSEDWSKALEECHLVVQDITSDPALLLMSCTVHLILIVVMDSANTVCVKLSVCVAELNVPQCA